MLHEARAAHASPSGVSERGSRPRTSCLAAHGSQHTSAFDCTSGSISGRRFASGAGRSSAGAARRALSGGTGGAPRPSALEREDGNRTIERPPPPPPAANCSYPSRTAPAGLALQRLERAARGGHQRIELVEPNPASRPARPGERPKPSQRQMYKWTGILIVRTPSRTRPAGLPLQRLQRAARGSTGG